ncbi:MAG: HAD-IIIC family phosphatase [Phycisphaerales bacterium]
MSEHASGQPGGQPEERAAPKVDPRALRAEIDAHVAAGDVSAATIALRKLWRASPDPATAGFVVARFDALRGQHGDKLAMTPARLAILRSYTVEPIVPMLKAGAYCAGIALDVYLSEFNAYVQDIINPSSPLYAFQPTVVVLAVQTRDIAPDLWLRFVDLSPQQVDESAQHIVDAYRSWIETLRRHTKAHVIVHNLERPAHPALGAFDRLAERSQLETIEKINAGIAAIAKAKSNVYVLDYDQLLARRGVDRTHDERKWLTVRMPLNAGEMGTLALEWLRFLHPICGRTCKALVLDLDNTLWGGVIGEDGMEGIKLDTEYPGAAFQKFQRAILDLFERGVILAINSKNNEADAMEAINNHPGMLLKADHFAAFRINWMDKATNLREIARELNIGIDSLAFFDDNPVEREWVASQLPEVTVIDVPADPMGYAAALRAAPQFERLSLSAEDRVRGRMYAENRLRSELQSQFSSMEEFYESLNMEMEFVPVGAGSLPRIAQLTQKTNQFNLTTRRYSEEQVASMAADPAWQLCAVRVKDRFGDNGIVGVAFTRLEGDEAEIDTLILSCRVIGRTVETGFLSYIAERAIGAGAKRLHGWYLPTKKNAPCKEFYGAHGFAVREQRDGGVHYGFDLTSGEIAWPRWIKRLDMARTGA